MKISLAVWYEWYANQARAKENGIQISHLKPAQ